MLKRIDLKGFRNFQDEHVEFMEGVHLVVGANAQGKTSLLEAIHLLSTGRVLRGFRDVEAISYGSDLAVVEGEIADSGTLLKVEIPRHGRKGVFLNHVRLPRASDLLGRLPCVAFSNLDLMIVRGDAGDRRAFLDEELSQIKPVYLRNLAGYRRALEHRNSLLKMAQEKRVERSEFEVWEHQLAAYGSELRITRKWFIEELSEDAGKHHALIGGGEGLQMDYLPKEEAYDPVEIEENLISQFQKDLARGTTSSGPHRDDFRILIQDQEARLFGSQGQQRTAALSIKLAVANRITAETDERPMVLLDDMLSELDKDRRRRVLELAAHLSAQTFLTCNEAEQAGDEVMRTASIFEVVRGTVKAK